MIFGDFERDTRYAQELDDQVRQEYPEYADEARDFMNSILRKTDKRIYRVFNGQAEDANMELGELSIMHKLICEALERRNQDIDVPDLHLENLVRTGLGFGWTVIEGGKN